MRLCNSIAEYNRDAAICSRGSGNDPLRWVERALRLALSATTRGCFLSFRRSRRATGLFDEPRRWACLSRFADDCRLPPLCFECLAKIVRLRILTKTFDLPPAIGRQLIVARADGLRKLAELPLQVKDLFLQIYDLSGAKIREFYSVRGDIKLPAQDRLADAEPPFFDHRSSIGRRFLEKPRRDQSLFGRGKRDHESVE